MTGATTVQRLSAEALSTAFLLAAVVGSGIMAERPAGGNMALAPLCNTLPTGAILAVLILMLGPVSGAHFNPAVGLAFALTREIGWGNAAGYVAAQILGAIAGVVAAHLMFDLPPFQAGAIVREGAGQWLGELVATFGLVLTILACVARNAAAIPDAVGLYITSAYWFTSSTSFANPAVTVARADRHVFGHCPRRCVGVHRRPADRRRCGDRCRPRPAEQSVQVHPGVSTSFHTPVTAITACPMESAYTPATRRGPGPTGSA